MGSSRRLGDILVEDFSVDRGDLEAALDSQRHAPDERLGRLLVRMGYLSERDLVTAVARQLGCAVILALPRMEIPENVLVLVPLALAERKLVVPVARSRNTLVLAMADPTDRATVDAISRITGLAVSVAIASEEDVRRAIKVFYLDEPLQRDPLEVSTSMESLRAHMHERTSGTSSSGTFRSPLADIIPTHPVEHASTAA